jgi:hypothetical protein
MALIDLFKSGKKPSVPAFVPINAQAAQDQAIQGNIGNFGDMSALASKTNQFNQDQLTAMLRQSIPGYDQMVSSATGNINSQLKGELPSDVTSLINRRMAAKSMAGGYGGSGMARNLEARDLGLTSLQLTNQGLSNAESWMANVRQYQTPSLMDVSSMFITPQQQLAQSTYERDAKWNRDWLAAKIKAMPDPHKLAMFSAISDPFGIGIDEGVGGVLGTVGQVTGGSSGGGGGGGLGAIGGIIGML